MKILPRLFVLAVLVVAALATMSPVALGAPQVVFADEFNGPLNTSAWANKTPWNTYYTTGESQWYDPGNCTFADGTMTLRAENRVQHDHPYSSGIVTSLPRAKFSYGYFEIRAKLPKGPGVWPAFWLTNDHSLEIDGFEVLGDRPDRVYMTLHEDDKQTYQGIKDGIDTSAAFHTYGIDWQPDHVRWYIDGALYAACEKPIPSDPLWIVLNTTVGGSWSGQPTAETKFPTDYVIDYVRVYDTMPAPTVATKPVVKVKDRQRNTYRVGGALRLGATVKATSSVLLRVQVQRLVRGKWRTYSTARLVNPRASYRTVVKVRKGTFRVRALVSVGGASAARSSWSKAFRAR